MTDLKLHWVNPHNMPDSPTDFSEDVERLERCRDEASYYFRKVQQEALRIRTDSMIINSVYRDAPRWLRAKAAREARYEATMAAANVLFKASVDELFKTGEISEALSYKWDELLVSQTMKQLEAAE